MNPHDRLRSADFKSAVSADFTIRAVASPFYRISSKPHMYSVGTIVSPPAYLLQARLPLAANNHAHLRNFQANDLRPMGHQAS